MKPAFLTLFLAAPGIALAHSGIHFNHGDWELASLAPEHARALQIGQWLHLGKNTTFGLGRYTLTEQP